MNTETPLHYTIELNRRLPRYIKFTKQLETYPNIFCIDLQKSDTYCKMILQITDPNQP